MTIDDINKLILGDETRVLELKKSTGELKDGMRSACAFLNTDGGWLVFGVTPISLKIIGQQVTDNTRREIARELAKIEPAVDLKVEYIALREALINALCHRTYDSLGTTVGIAIYDDRVEIENPGSFPLNITAENIKHPHDSYPRNPLIANVLYLSTYLEKWGSGVVRIMETCKQQGLPEPMYEDRNGFIHIVLKRKTFVHANEPQSEPQNEPQSEPQKQLSGKLSGRQSQIIDVIKSNSRIKKSEIAKMLSISESTVAREIKNINNYMTIYWKGSSKGGNWEIINSDTEL